MLFIVTSYYDHITKKCVVLKFQLAIISGCLVPGVPGILNEELSALSGLAVPSLFWK